MTVCPCGRTMSFTGAGSRRVDGEQDAIHTQGYRCGTCGFTDFAPRMHGDPTREEAYAAFTEGVRISNMERVLGSAVPNRRREAVSDMAQPGASQLQELAKEEPARPVEVDSLLAEQENALERLETAIMQAEQRLGPVLRPPAPDVERSPNGPPEPEPSTLIGRRINEAQHRVRVATNTIHSLIQRLEV